MSYVSHSQLWALQIDKQLYLGGKTNRAQVTFEREFLEILQQLQSEIPAQPGVKNSISPMALPPG